MRTAASLAQSYALIVMDLSHSYRCWLLMPPLPTIGAQTLCFSVVCPLTPLSSEAASLYLVVGFHWNLPQIFIILFSIYYLFLFI